MTESLERITRDPKIMSGKACIRGVRVTVGMIVGQIGAGRSVEQILDDYPYLEREDIMQALRYAAWLSTEPAFANGETIALDGIPGTVSVGAEAKR